MEEIVDCTGVVTGVVARSRMANTWNIHLPSQIVRRRES